MPIFVWSGLCSGEEGFPRELKSSQKIAKTDLCHNSTPAGTICIVADESELPDGRSVDIHRITCGCISVTVLHENVTAEMFFC